MKKNTSMQQEHMGFPVGSCYCMRSLHGVDPSHPTVTVFHRTNNAPVMGQAASSAPDPQGSVQKDGREKTCLSSMYGIFNLHLVQFHTGCRQVYHT